MPADATTPRNAAVPRVEQMDEPGLDWGENQRALADLDRINVLLMGFWAVRRAALPRLLSAGLPRQLLFDLGTGSGLATARLAKAAGRQGIALRVVGVDRKLTHLVLGRRSGIAQLRVVADAKALPFRSGSGDWTLSTLFWHHFDPPTNQDMLVESLRVTRLGAMVVDLRRSRLAALLARVLLPCAGAGAIARQDGYLSLARAWRLDAIAATAAGLRIEELRRRFPFRFSLIVTSHEGESSVPRP